MIARGCPLQGLLDPDGLRRWIAIAVLVAALWLGRDVLPPFVVAAMLAYLLSPVVAALARRTGIRRGWAALTVCTIVVALLVAGFWLIESRLASEAEELAAAGPDIAGAIAARLTGGQPISILGQQLTPDDLSARLREALRSELPGLSGGIQVVTTAVELAFRTFLALVVFGYLLADGPRLSTFLLDWIPDEHTETVARIASDIHGVLSHYVRGQLILVALMSLVTFVGLEWFFHLRYALPIAVVSGLLEIIPLVGPVSAAAMACAVGFVQGGASLVGELALFYLVLRQLEDHLVMPQVIGRAVRIHPVVTIYAVLVGERLAGPLGMLLAVPCAAALKVVLDYAGPRRKREVTPPAGTGRRRPPAPSPDRTQQVVRSGSGAHPDRTVWR